MAMTTRRSKYRSPYAATALLTALLTLATSSNGQIQTYPFSYNDLDYQGNDNFNSFPALSPFVGNGAGAGVGGSVGHNGATVPKSAFNSVFNPQNKLTGHSFSHLHQYGLQLPRGSLTGYPSPHSLGVHPLNHHDNNNYNHLEETDAEDSYKQTKSKKKKHNNKKNSYRPKNKRKFRKRKNRKHKKQLHKITYQEYPGFSIIGGSQIHGKVWSLHSCKAACKKAPDCFAGDYNKRLKKCYLHSNTTACLSMQTDHPVVHFQKVPCIAPETTNGRVMLGVQIFGGIETKAKNILDCIHNCANMGNGIAANIAALTAGFNQVCAAVDYDFATKKCYIHGDAVTLCPAGRTVTPPDLPVNLVKNPTVVNVLLCPPLT